MIPEGKLIENEIREKINFIEEQNNMELSTTQKILLTIGGPITTILDVLFGSVNLFMLNQHFEKADKNVAELLNVDEDEEIDYREVIVHKNGRPLVYAKSYIPLSRCSDRVIDDLRKEELTTGKIMAKNNIETIRKINEIYIETPDATLQELFKTSEPMLTREYVMIHHAKIVIWTKESYPLSYFRF